MVSQPRKVVFLESAAAMGGVQFSTLNVAQTLDRSRWKAIVVCPEEGDLPNACREAGVETSVLAQPRLWSTSLRAGRNARLPNPFAWFWNAMVVVRAARRLKSFLRRSAPDLIVSKGLSSHFIGGFAAWRLGIPCVWHVQDFISERTFGIYRRMFTLAARWFPQTIIADGGIIRKQLGSSVSSKTIVIHNGIDTRIFQPAVDGSSVRDELAIAKDQLVIGHAARITPWKGQHYLLEAFARLADEFPNTVLLLAGSPVFDNDAYERRLRTMAADFGLQHRIKFAGYRDDLPHVLAAMDVFAFTSIEKDTSPLALLSAMSTGLPIVAFDIDGVKDLMSGDEYLLRIPIAELEALSGALRKLISDAPLRASLGKAARQVAEEKFSLDQHVSLIESVLTKAITSSSSSATENTSDLSGERLGKISSPESGCTSVVRPG